MKTTRLRPLGIAMWALCIVLTPFLISAFAGTIKGTVSTGFEELHGLSRRRCRRRHGGHRTRTGSNRGSIHWWRTIRDGSRRVWSPIVPPRL